ACNLSDCVFRPYPLRPPDKKPEGVNLIQDATKTRKKTPSQKKLQRKLIASQKRPRNQRSLKSLQKRKSDICYLLGLCALAFSGRP
ncbi:hypothetical protein ACIQVE_22740, partial [Pseudomonas sp. NPDC098747]|uniref:hypothetical protein n=1 Tax=Pseudomonas sp. NPDC098747 TaxID=3364487 RepID=UPI00383A732A